MAEPLNSGMVNHHATALILGDRGVLVRGPSGAGKTSLALALVERCRRLGRFGCLVADDQLFLEKRHGRLACQVPVAIAGLAEIRGVGPRPADFEPRAIIDLVVDLVERAVAPRFPQAETIVLEGVEIGHLVLSSGEMEGAALAIMDRLVALC